MSIGSSFDAYCKSYLHEMLFGKDHDPKFSFNAIFETQVEPHNRDWALKAGKYAFDSYKNSGALGDLATELHSAIGPPRFEIEIKGVIHGHREGVTKNVGDVTFLGKPDIFFINKTGCHVTFDWKVNGFCSLYNVSPMQGYVRVRERGKTGHWSNSGAHKNAHLMAHHGMIINICGFLEQFDETWARQLGIYGWLAGEDIGSDFIVAVDQLACKPSGGEWPHIRVAEHRLRVGVEYQWKIFAQAQYVWEVVHSEHIFRDMTLQESKHYCAVLDNTAKALRGDGSEADQWFSDVTRG